MSESVGFSVFLQDHVSNGLFKIQGISDRVFDSVGKDIDTVNRKSSGLGSTFSGLSGMIGSLGIGLAAFSTIKSMGSLAIDAEQTNIAFETMLGSAEKGKQAITDLKDFAATTPFESDEIIKSGKSLLAFGFTVDELKPNLTSIGNVASGLNIPFTELSEIFGKAKVQGTVFSEDLNQLAGRGVPIFTELAKVMGKPSGEIKKLASEGKIGFAQIQQAFNNMSGPGGQFFELMDKQSQTVGGRWSTLKDGASALGLEIGNGLLPVMSLGIDKITALVGVATQAYHWIGENRTIFESLGVAVGFGATAWGLYTLAVSASSIATTIYTGSQWLLNAALTANPIGIVVVGLSAIAGGLYYAWEKSEQFRATILGLWEAGKTVFRNLAGSALQYLGGLGDLLKGIFTLDLDLLKKGFGDTVNGLKGFYGGAGEGVADAFNKGFGDGLKPQTVGVKGATASSTANSASIGPGGVGVVPSVAPPSNIKAGISGVQGDAKASRNFTVNIDKMVENFTVHTTSIKDNPRDIETALRETLMRVIHDTELLGG